MADIQPTTMAQQLAGAYTSSAQSLLTAQNTVASSKSTALTKLRSTLTTFENALAALSGQKSVLKNSASFDNTGFGTASASATAQPGSYSFFVETLAATHQVSYANINTVSSAGAGSLAVNLAGGDSFSVSLSAADLDGDGSLSPAELARGINSNAGNAGKVTASILTINGQSQLVLAAGQSGADGQITLGTTGVTDTALRASLNAGNALVTGRDAVVWLGDQTTGVRMQQSSNNFTSVPGVSVTFTKTMQTGDAPVKLTVASDESGTTANVQKFVDAYNALEKALDEMTKNANADSKTSAAAFASDAGVRTLRNRLGSIVREPIGGLRLADFGIGLDRTGAMTLDSAKLQKGLAAHPDGLDTVFGKASASAPTGVFGALDTYIDLWTNSATGQIQSRQTSLQKSQKSLAAKQTQLDTRYENLYQRYLKQFTALQQLQASMSGTSSLFTNLETQ